MCKSLVSCWAVESLPVVVQLADNQITQWCDLAQGSFKANMDRCVEASGPDPALLDAVEKSGFRTTAGAKRSEMK